MIFGYLSKSNSPKCGESENPKMKNTQKRTFWKELLAQLCSQIVLCPLFGVSLKIAFFAAESTIKIAVSAPPPKQKSKEKTKHAKQIVLKTGRR